MYRGLEHAGTATLPAACDAYPARGISLSGLSKTVGLPGLRIGWLASQDEQFMARVGQLKDYTTICPAAPSEVSGRAHACMCICPAASSEARGHIHMPAYTCMCTHTCTHAHAHEHAPSQVLGLCALRARDTLLSRSRQTIARGLAACRAMAADHPELLEWSEPRGGD